MPSLDMGRQNGLLAASRPFAASLPHGEGLQFKLHNEGRALSDDIAAASRGSSHHAGRDLPFTSPPPTHA